MTTLPLFSPLRPAREQLELGAWLLRGFALEQEAAVIAAVIEVTGQAPYRHMVTPGGRTMSVLMTNCGQLGWVSDARGYRYTKSDPHTGAPWPAMPACFWTLAQRAARAAGFESFEPNGCLINHYAPGARMTLHQDNNERDMAAPIVSVSLGLPGVFLWGGTTRSDKPRRIDATHGDVIVWGGPARLRFHGLLAVKPGHHSMGNARINLTFRQA